MGILKMDLIAPKEIHGDYHKIVGVPLTDSFWDVLQSSHAPGKFPETPCVAQLGRIWAPWLTSRCRFAGLEFGVSGSASRAAIRMITKKNMLFKAA